MFQRLSEWVKKQANPLSDKAELHILMVCTGSTPRTYERADRVRIVCGINPA
jgi:hypothetical protein